MLIATLGWSQGTGGSSGTSTSAPSSTSTNRPRSTSPSTSTDQFRGPMFISGRVISELGRPVSEPVSVELNCGMRAVQVIHTDLGGYFTFNLGSGTQSNIDFSASNESPTSFSSAANNLPNRYGNPLAGCELRLSVSGFRPTSLPMTHTSDMGRVDVGNISLERIGGVKGSAVSVTSLLVPKEAAKEFEKGIKDLQNNKPDAALPHLEKAVAFYDKYAAAWNEIGRIYVVRNDIEKASTAFEKSTAADPDYIPPLLNLATLHIQNHEWQPAVDAADKILALDNSIGFASFLRAVGDFNLHKVDEAEKSAAQAEKMPHEDNPQVHALLAQIYMEKQQYVQAAAHIRSYLKEAPDGAYAAQMKKDLSEIEAWVGAADAAGASSGSATPAPVPGS
jgi:tetratricopeptide (TPR) repeat protein